jgi:hypothetical protein
MNEMCFHSLWQQFPTTGLSRSLSLGIIKNGQELVEIWPKTFLYTYFVVNLPDLLLFYVELYDIIKITTTHITICTM